MALRFWKSTQTHKFNDNAALPRPRWRRPLGIILGILVIGILFSNKAKHSAVRAENVKTQAPSLSGQKLDQSPTAPHASSFAARWAGAKKWQVTIDKNPLDDSERVTIALQANTGKGLFGKAVYFVARCQSKKTETYINWNIYVGNDSNDVYANWKYITLRIGNNKAVKQRWGVSTDKQATFAPSWAGKLLKQMANSDRFIAQIIPFSANPITAIFDTSGLSDALKPLMKACEWSIE